MLPFCIQPSTSLLTFIHSPLRRFCWTFCCPFKGLIQGEFVVLIFYFIDWSLQSTSREQIKRL